LGDLDRRLLVELLTGDLERDRLPGDRDFLELFAGDRERDLDLLRVLDTGLRERLALRPWGLRDLFELEPAGLWDRLRLL